jgi:hypothetical protein
LPDGVPISGCLLLGLNGGTVGAAHDVTATSDLTLTYSGAEAPAQHLLGNGSEFCFGQSSGCQAATAGDALSFASVQTITQPGRLVALFGDISDSTFDGSSEFGSPPKGPWTATNDFFVYHGADCAALDADPDGGIAGPADFYDQIPADAVHLLSVPVHGDDIGAGAVPVFEPFAEELADGDCLVTLSGVQGSGAFDCEAQVIALVQ